MKNFVIVFELFRIMIAALSFLLDYEKIEDDNSDDSDASSSEDDSNPQMPAVISKEAIYKVSFILCAGIRLMNYQVNGFFYDIVYLRPPTSLSLGNNESLRKCSVLPSQYLRGTSHSILFCLNCQAHHKGTVSSKKKKKAKLQRAMRSMKRQQRLSSEKRSSNYYSPLSHLKDAQVSHYSCYNIQLSTCS